MIEELSVPLSVAGAPTGRAALPAGERLRCVVARMLGLRMISDIHDRAADLGLSLPPGAKRRQRLAAARRAGVLFVHIPKNAGQSVSDALYGLQVRHASIRYYAQAAPDIARLPSFALLRDPVARFVSAYHYAASGGRPDNEINPAFIGLYAGFRRIEDAIDHVEAAASPYAIDHIFRPQSWYVTDRQGRVAVDRLLHVDDLPWLGALVPEARLGAIAHLNARYEKPPPLGGEAAARLRRLYAADYALLERIKS